MEKVILSYLRYIWINITSNCNNKCTYCYDTGHKQSEISISTFTKILELIQELGITRLTLIGGEPTLHSSFIDLLNLCKDYGVRPVIVTNGTKFSDLDFCKKILDIGLNYVLLSLTGSNAQIHDNTTRRTGSFNEIMRAIDNLMNLGGVNNVRTITTITKRNFRDLKSVIDLTKNMGIPKTIFNLCSPPLKGDGGYNCFSPKENAQIIKDIYLYSKEIGQQIEIATNVPRCVFNPQLVNELIEHKVIRPSLCQVYKTSGVQFLSDGSITPCTHMFNYILGNPIKEKLNRNEFLDMLNNGSVKKFRESMWNYPSAKCINCQYWGNCIGGCPLMWTKFSPLECL